MEDKVRYSEITLYDRYVGEVGAGLLKMISVVKQEDIDFLASKAHDIAHALIIERRERIQNFERDDIQSCKK